MRFRLRVRGYFLFYAAFAVGLLSPLLFFGKVYYFRDFGRFYAPIKEYCLDLMVRGELPIWIPEMNCGTPVHGELVHGLLYPGNVLLLAGPTTGWGVYFAAHLLLAALGARALALRLGATREGALAAGIAFAGSGYLVSQMNHVPYATAAAWAPWIAWLALAGREGKRVAWPWLGVAFGMAALAGEPFTVLMTVLFTGVLLLAGLGGPRIAAFLRLGIGGITGILLASPALLPAWLQIGESARAEGLEVARDGFGSLHPARLFTAISPEAMGQIQKFFNTHFDTVFGEVEIGVPILLAAHLGALTVVALFLAPYRRSRAALTLGAIAGGALLLSLGSYLGLAPLIIENVPGLALFRYPDKFWFLVTIAAAPILALTLPGLTRRRTLIAALVTGGVGLAASVVFGHTDLGLLGILPFLLLAGVFLQPAEQRGRAHTLVLAAELLFFGLRHHGLSDPADVNPLNGIGRQVRDLDPGRLFVDLSSGAVTQQPDVQFETEQGYLAMDSMVGIPYGFHYTMGYDPTEPLMRIPHFFGLPKELTPHRRTLLFHRLLRLTANTHSVTTTNLGRDPQIRLVGGGGPKNIHLYAYRKPLARARLYGDTRYVADYEAGRKLIQNLEFDPFATLLLEGEGEPETRGEPQGTVIWERDEARKIRLRVFSDRGAWLFLSDAWAPGWKAWLDGKPVPIEIAHIAFRAVRVPKGESVVTFHYEPGWLRGVPFTTGAGLAILLGAFIAGWRRRRKSRISD